MRWLITATLLIASSAFAGKEPDDEEGAVEHPDVSRFPGFRLTEGEATDFSALELATGAETTVTKEGRSWRIQYELRESAKKASPEEITRNYAAAFAKRGGKMVYKSVDAHGGVATYQMPLGKSERWMQVRLSNGATGLLLEIVEVGAMQQKVEVTADQMLQALEKDGFIALRGINFDTGKDTLKPDSEPLLAEIVTLLKANVPLVISIEGHTDNIGNPKSNDALSKRRAERVRQHLTSKGIDAKRLTSAGFGDTKPVADNRTEEGRALNRRVELVKKKSSPSP
ncbi:MAG: OmpA family protein [Deltaproteobacteria bacterium]|nr:OmpA family protein [Deltaproteobacteria bacterium]